MIALRSGTVAGTASAERQRQRAAQPAPEQGVLVGRRKAPARPAGTGPRADRSTGRARRARAGSRLPRRAEPSCAQRLVGDVHPDQDEDEAVGEEREIFPCRSARDRGPSSDRSAGPADAADHQAGGERADDPRRVEMLGEQERRRKRRWWSA